jgi:hypothetical protein
MPVLMPVRMLELMLELELLVATFSSSLAP